MFKLREMRWSNLAKKLESYRDYGAKKLEYYIDMQKKQKKCKICKEST